MIKHLVFLGIYKTCAFLRKCKTCLYSSTILEQRVHIKKETDDLEIEKIPEQTHQLVQIADRSILIPFPFDPPISFQSYVNYRSFTFYQALDWINDELKYRLSLAQICKKHGITQTSGITKFFTEKAPRNEKYFQKKTDQGYYEYQLLTQFEQSEIHTKIKDELYPFIIRNDHLNVVKIPNSHLVNTSLSLTKINYNFIKSLCDSKVLTQSTFINLIITRLPRLLEDQKFFDLLISPTEKFLSN
jgi:hypothetical protein